MRTSPLQVEPDSGLPLLLCRLWAGLACGMLAGVAALLWLMLHSLVRGEFWWAKFNVAAGWFYGMAVYRAGLSGVTLCGAAVVMLFFCLAGACYAWSRAGLFRAGPSLTSAFYVTAVYVFAAYFFWPSFGPFARLWFPWTATLPAHIALFAMLARYPALCARLTNEFAGPARILRKTAGLPVEPGPEQPLGAASSEPEAGPAQPEPRGD